MLRLLTAGESHGRSLLGIVEGIPAGLQLGPVDIDMDLRRRQVGYGRGDRMTIEEDQIEILSGVAKGVTTGAPISFRIENRGTSGWRGEARTWATVPRPGHADLAGAIKHGHKDLSLVAERASARETAARVAAGAIAKKLLSQCQIAVASYVSEIGEVVAQVPDLPPEELFARAETSDLRCPDPRAAEDMRSRIDEVKSSGDTVGGVFVVVATGVFPGLGSYVQWDRRLDGQLAQAVASIPGVKGVEIGPAFANARLRGTEVHDEICVVTSAETGAHLARHTNRAGGLEGGVSNGEPIVIRAAMKPIPSTMIPLRSVDLATMTPADTEHLRADVCAVPAAGVVGEAMVAWVLAAALLDKFGGDSMAELLRGVQAYLHGIPWRWPRPPSQTSS
jgi:chorismate synthase